ncbi:MAG: hypothetical protein WKF97_05100 [Chitinophagaceae bacterium]
MKTLLLSIILLSFVAGFGQSEPAQIKAETTAQAKKARIHITTFGFKGGYNRSIVNGYETIGAKTGYTGNELYGSFFADTELSGKLNFETELLVSWTDDYHFVEVPLHLKYKFTSKWSACYYLKKITRNLTRLLMKSHINDNYRLCFPMILKRCRLKVVSALLQVPLMVIR